MFKLINDDMRPGVQVLAREIEDGKVIPCVCPYRNGHVMPAQEFIDPISKEMIIRPPKLIEAYCGTNCPHFAFVEEATDPVTGITDGDTGISTCKRFIVINP